MVMLLGKYQGQIAMNDTPKIFVDALARDQEARATFTWMSQSHRAAFNVWVQAAHTETERLSRVREALDMLAGRECVRRH
jgi:uncharacterized protein YdeI (YjbR/CyaY-like superfamily)